MKDKKKRVKLAENYLKKIINAKSTDAFRLILMLEEKEDVDFSALDLFSISEFKSSKDGYQIKFFDKIDAAQAIVSLNGEQTDGDAFTELYKAIALGSGNGDG